VPADDLVLGGMMQSQSGSDLGTAASFTERTD
jgi:hypothetical protein